MTQDITTNAGRVVALPSTTQPGRVSQATAIEQTRAVAEVQAAVMVAQANPRNVRNAYAAMRVACGRLYLAERARYSVVNRGSGPTIHLARELARIWCNLDSGVRELRRDDDQSEVLAYAWDQEANTRTSRSFIIPHQRMVNVDGKQTRRDLYDLQDIYLNNQNVGARALRECIFALLPAEFVDEAIRLCKATVQHGDGVPMETRIQNMVSHFATLGVKVRQIETRVGRSRGQWTPEDLAELAIVNSSIQRGDTTARDEFPPEAMSVAELHTATQAPPAPTPVPPASEPAADPTKTAGEVEADKPARRRPAAREPVADPESRAGSATGGEPIIEDPPPVAWPDVPTIPGT